MCVHVCECMHAVTLLIGVYCYTIVWTVYVPLSHFLPSSPPPAQYMHAQWLSPVLCSELLSLLSIWRGASLAGWAVLPHLSKDKISLTTTSSQLYVCRTFHYIDVLAMTSFYGYKFHWKRLTQNLYCKIVVAACIITIIIVF